jgi:hypothetical protein
MGHFERFEDDDTKQDQILPIPPVPVALIWDVGPAMPVAPKEPRKDCSSAEWGDYMDDVRAHAQAMRRFNFEHDAWIAKYRGPAQLELDPLTAREFAERDPKRYLTTLPADIEPGPHRGVNRIILTRG